MIKCYICECALSRGTMERDHFPVNACEGGIETLPICRGCHDLKDRTPFSAWDPERLFAGLASLWIKASRDERLILCRLFGQLGQCLAFLRSFPAAKTED